MADNSRVVRITVNGASLGVVDKKVYAFLLESERAADWVITPAGDGVQVADRASGAVLAVPSTEDFTQAELVDQGAANSRWSLIMIDYDDDSEKPVTQVTETGLYFLVLAGTKKYLGRHFIEDRSLMPKRVMLVPEENEPRPLVFEIVG